MFFLNYSSTLLNDIIEVQQSGKLWDVSSAKAPSENKENYVFGNLSIIQPPDWLSICYANYCD